MNSQDDSTHSYDGISGRKRSRSSGKSDDSSAVREYYALFENLVVMVLDWRNWSRSLRNFMKTEAAYRGRLVFVAIGFLVAALTSVIVAVCLLALGFYQLLSWATGSPIIASFILFVGFLVLAAVLFGFLMKTGLKLLEPRDREDDLYKDELDSDDDEDDF